jgi:hypothetical protein
MIQDVLSTVSHRLNRHMREAVPQVLICRFNVVFDSAPLLLIFASQVVV